MTTEITPAKVRFSDQLGHADEAQRLPDAAGLVPCALCGEDKGYTLDEGSTYRWWSVKCAACGQEVAEARCNHPTETTTRTTRADDAWNDAGAHAAGMRAEIERLRAALAAFLPFAPGMYGNDPRSDAEIGDEAAAEIEMLREMLEDLAKAVWMLDQAGYIGTDDEDGEVECALLRRIARQTVDAYTAYRRPNGCQ